MRVMGAGGRPWPTGRQTARTQYGAVYASWRGIGPNPRNYPNPQCNRTAFAIGIRLRVGAWPPPWPTARAGGADGPPPPDWIFGRFGIRFASHVRPFNSPAAANGPPWPTARASGAAHGRRRPFPRQRGKLENSARNRPNPY